MRLAKCSLWWSASLLEHEVHSQSSEEDDGVDWIEWRNLLRSFSNVKILREDGLVEELSHCLRLEDGELPLELLPELQELTYFESRDTGDAFASFIDARQNAGRPVTLVRPNPSPSPFNPETAPIPTLSLSVGENYCALVSEDPMLGSFRPMHYFGCPMRTLMRSLTQSLQALPSRGRPDANIDPTGTG
jgi:hypothetical protein